MQSRLGRTSITVPTQRSTRHIRVGAPHILSNIRPVVYDAETKLSVKNAKRHPYALDEFSFAIPQNGPASSTQASMSSDYLDHAFWSSVKFGQLFLFFVSLHVPQSNRRYQELERSVLATLSTISREEEREATLGKFRHLWLTREAPRQKAYNIDLQQRIWRQISLAALSFVYNLRDKMFTRRTGDGLSTKDHL